MLELNEFDLAQAGHSQSLYRDNFKPDVGAYRRTGEHSQWRKPEERSVNGLSYPWKTGEQLFEANRYRPPWAEYERGNLEERLYARHSRMYEIGKVRPTVDFRERDLITQCLDSNFFAIIVCCGNEIHIIWFKR